MSNPSVPTWHPVPSATLHHEIEALGSPADIAGGDCTAVIAIVETFGSGWYANAMPPLADGTSSMIPGCIRGGAYGDSLEAAKAWCERVAGLHPEKPGDRRSELTEQAI